MIKKVVFWLLISFILSTPTFASLANTRNDLHIIPETQESNEELDKKVKDIAKNPGRVLETYNNKADELAQKGDLGSAFATGIFNRDLILLYIAYLVQFLSQLGMLIWGILVVYAGYLYAGTIFGFWDVKWAKTAIEQAIKGILVISFSYAILKILTSMFIS